MDKNSDRSKNKHNEHLGVNNIGKNIRKNSFHQPIFANPARQPSQPQVYNINKNDFRNIVQRLTSSPSGHSQEPLLRTPQNQPKPPPLTPINGQAPGLLPSPPMNSGDHRAATAVESPVSAYMRNLQNSPGLLPNPQLPPLQPPRMGGPPPLLPPPRSSYPLLSPRYRHPPTLTPDFPILPLAQSGILGPGPQSPPSPGNGFPLSPGYFTVSSPRWRD